MFRAFVSAVWYNRLRLVATKAISFGKPVALRIRSAVASTHTRCSFVRSSSIAAMICAGRRCIISLTVFLTGFDIVQPLSNGQKTQLKTISAPSGVLGALVALSRDYNRESSKSVSGWISSLLAAPAPRISVK